MRFYLNVSYNSRNAAGSPLPWMVGKIRFCESEINSYICKPSVQNMHHRLKQFLAAENISQSQFADEIGVARASVSHILSGRNKPGFEFIENMLSHYPALSSEWLIMGKGKMYKEATLGPISSEPAQPQEGLFSQPSQQPTPLPSAVESKPEPAAPIERKTLEKAVQIIEKQKNIVKVVVFYDDNSFLEIK